MEIFKETAVSKIACLLLFAETTLEVSNEYTTVGFTIPESILKNAGYILHLLFFVSRDSNRRLLLCLLYLHKIKARRKIEAIVSKDYSTPSSLTRH